MSSKKKQRTTSAARATIEASLQIALELAQQKAGDSRVPVAVPVTDVTR
jgi:hypothetical protein